MRKSKRPRRTDAPKKYGEVKIIQQPGSLIAGTDICIATGKQIPLTAPRKMDFGVVSSD